MRGLHGILFVLVIPVLLLAAVLIVFLFCLEGLHLVDPGGTEAAVKEMLAALDEMNAEEDARGKIKIPKEAVAKIHPMLQGATILSQLGGHALPVMTPQAEQAHEALRALGYTKQDAANALARALPKVGQQATTETIIKEALKP